MEQDEKSKLERKELMAEFGELMYQRIKLMANVTMIDQRASVISNTLEKGESHGK